MDFTPYIVVLFLFFGIAIFLTLLLKPWQYPRQERQARRRVEDAVHVAMTAGILKGQTFFVPDGSADAVRSLQPTDRGPGVLVRCEGANEFWVANVAAGQDPESVGDHNYSLFRM